MILDLRQKELVAEYMKDKHCISAWKNNRSMILISELDDHEPLFNYLFDHGWKVENVPLATWQYYADANIDRIRCFFVDQDFFDKWFLANVDYLENL